MAGLVVTAVCILLIASYHSAESATCRYRRSSDTIRCGHVECSTVEPAYGIDRLLPGEYRIGTYYVHDEHQEPWFNLYRKSPAGKYWDYYTKIP